MPKHSFHSDDGGEWGSGGLGACPQEKFLERGYTVRNIGNIPLQDRSFAKTSLDYGIPQNTSQG